MLIKIYLVVLSVALVLSVSYAKIPSTLTRFGDNLSPIDNYPDPALINDLDQAIQRRFLDEQKMGFSRVAGPVLGRHFDVFEPRTEEERQILTELRARGWRAGLYLFGRRAYEKSSNDKSTKRASVQYRLNRALPLTGGTKQGSLIKPKKLLAEADAAFDEFRRSDEYNFQQGKWSYTARAVKASESCLKCHADFFITAKLDKKRYKYRPRQAGDPIGVLIYAFRKGQ